MASRGPAQPDRHHVVALEEQYCGTPDLDLGEPYTLTSYATTANDEVADRIKPATILLTNTVTLNAYHLSSQYSPKLRMIAVQASGTDAIDLAACRKRGIVVCNASKANVPAVSEHAIGLYFAARRQFALTERALRADEWRRNGHCMHVMKDGNGKMPLTCRDEIMGLIGYGVIGQRIGELACVLGMSVMVSDRKGATTFRTGRHAFEKVLKECTVLVLVLPRTPESLNLISTKELSTMKRQAVIINVARGGILNEDALLQTLRERQIAGAATDVFLEEPAGPHNSALLTEDTKDINLIVTPHVAWVAETTTRDMSLITKLNVEAWHAGRPVNVVV